MTTATPLLRLDHVSKSFGPVTVIRDVSVDVHPGKVHCLLGENGAGKSTLIKMMSGIYQPDHGEVHIDGTPTRLSGPKDAEAHGIVTIHQELNLVPTMSVAENIMLGRTPARFGIVNRGELRRWAQAAIDLVGLDVDLDTPVGQLGIARQQLVEIAKALSVNARVLILDEPTAALTGREIAQLFTIVDDLRSRGVGMVFISHHLDELAAIGDTISVLRDGAFVGQVPADTPESDLVQMMVGRDIDDQFPRKAPERGKPLLTVKEISSAGKFEDISLTLHAGEVVGLAGLVGAGRTELIRALAGADPYDSGTVEIAGKPLRHGDIATAIAAGIGHVPEDRKAQGLVLDGSVGDNLGYATLAPTARFGLVDRSGQRRRADDVASRLRIRMAGLNQPVRNLSGGNQQKVVFGRWVLAGSEVLLLDEPTRGVDVGAKVEIYELINAVTAKGGAVLMVSSELPEVIGMSDRILVMSAGRIAGELSAADATQDAIMTLAVSRMGAVSTNPSPATQDHAPASALHATPDEEA